MHILMVAPEKIPVPGSGSVEICILSIAEQLAKQHQVTIISRQAPKYSSTSDLGNLKIVRVSARRQSSYISSVLQYINGRHYDLIQVDNRPHYMRKVKQAFPQTPVSLFLHSLTFIPRTAKVAASLNSADLIIVNSNSLKRNVGRLFPSQTHKLRTVYLGVDPSRFKPPSQGVRNERREEYGIGDSFAILFTGRIVPRKGIPILIKATQIARRKVGDAKLIIAGKGSEFYIRKLKSQAAKLKVPVHFVGNIPHDEINRLYQSADCFVCPSQKHESFGLVNVEAMSTEVPVVASKIGGIKEIIDHGINGYLVGAYRNAERFAHYITTIAHDQKKAEELTKRGRKTVMRRFTWHQTAKKLNAIYTDFLLK